MKPVRKMFKAIIAGIGAFFKGIARGIRFIITSIFALFKWIVLGFYNAIRYSIKLIVKTVHAIRFYFKKYFITPLLPSYKVVFSMYQVVPGLPINRSESVHQFEKGCKVKAISFYNNVVKTTAANKIVPSEVYLVKRKKIVARQQFGPINEIKKLNVA